MAAFNSMPAGTPVEGLHQMNHGAGQQDLDLQNFDHNLNFDEAILDGGALPMSFTPSCDFDSFATFEDPFSYSTMSFQPQLNQQDAPNEATTPQSPQELDNKLLGFSDTIVHATVMDETGIMCDINMTAELYGMFFVAEDVFGAEGAGRPLELTCYRRNLWQCSGQIRVPRNIVQALDAQGRQIPITDISASLTGFESIEGKNAEIISIPWKNANPLAPPEPRVAGPPSPLTIDLSSGQELDGNTVTLPVSWKRLQFKHATANNGRRKGLQQHYVVQICLLGRTNTGDTITIAEIRSGPVIVRGRSPRNFDSRKDVALTGDRKTTEKKIRSNSMESSHIRTEREALQTQNQNQASKPNQNQTGNDWSTPQAFPQPLQSPHPAKRVAMSPTVAKPPVPLSGWTSEATPGNISAKTMKSVMNHRQGTSAPIALSLSEDERSPNRLSVEVASPQLGKSYPLTGRGSANSPPEDADPLYEYFPLSIDDWMPPIDAVYRPHVVHHTKISPEMKAQQMHRRAKRYFAAD